MTVDATARADICRPVTFETLGEAATAAETIRRATSDTRRPYLAYRCLDCGHWHLHRRRVLDPADPDDRRRIDLLDAGWRQINNPDVETWSRPNRKKTSASNRKTLDEAWQTMRRQAEALAAITTEEP